MTEISRRGLIAGGLAAAGLVGTGKAFAQSFPSQRFNLTVGYSTGGLADTIARIFSGYLDRTFPEPSIVQNRPGANGALGWEMVARQPADGYNLLASTQSQIVLAPATTPSLNLDPINGLTHISTLVESPYVLWASPQLEAETFEDLIDLAKTRSQPIFYGTSGIGGQQHLATELLALETGIKLEPVHYAGGGAMMPDLMSNRIQLGFATPGLAMGAYREGAVRPLLVIDDAEDPNFSGIPATGEVGLSRMKTLLGWYGLNGPAGIPDEVADSLNQIVHDCLETPEVQLTLERQMVRTVHLSRQEFAERIAQEYAEVQELVKAIDFPLG